jgi:alkanesulfonate monooxygenase SsuD/methylene tetrahydromethanopterin reductase-like flavin-dependent oxidoreductase (luciferase family)
MSATATTTPPEERPAPEPRPLEALPREFHLGFFTHVHGSGDAAALYRGVVELFVAGEELGFDSGWVAQHHFHDEFGRLPSPLVLLAAAAARTTHIELGTAIVTLPFEDPLRLAEDAAVLDALSGGRLQLGLGSGAPIGAEFTAFGQRIDERHRVFAEKQDALLRALRGEPLAQGPAGEPPGSAARPVLQPAAGSLAGRVWDSTIRPDAAETGGQEGRGILLGVGPADVVQRNLAAAHRRGWAAEQPDRPAPVAAVRGVFPGPGRAQVAAALAPDVARYLPHHVAAGWATPDIDVHELLRLMNVQYGHPDEIVASLRRDPAFGPHSSHLVVAVQAESTTLDQALRHMEVLATDIAPALGWKPRAHEPKARASEPTTTAAGPTATGSGPKGGPT